jgi:hypothetical protein
MNITIPIRQASGMHDFILREKKPVLWHIYFHKLQNGNFNARTITFETNMVWLQQQIQLGRIYLPMEAIISEKS